MTPTRVAVACVIAVIIVAGLLLCRLWPARPIAHAAPAALAVRTMIVPEQEGLLCN